MLLDKLYKYRFEIFFFSLVFVLFGSLFFPNMQFESHISPLLFLFNILSGLLFFIKKGKQALMVMLLFFIVLCVFLFNRVTNSEEDFLRYLRLIVYFVFYCLVTFKIIRQVWNAKAVNRSVIFGLMSGYISLGLLGFFTFFCIELVSPGSFVGILVDLTIEDKIDDLLYFSYITIMTIGYGDISPATELARSTTVLFGIIGQFYLVIVTAVVIEKYIRFTHKA